MTLRTHALLLMCAGCAAAGRSDRPPAPGPAPSPGAISALGPEGALRAGSDYVVASTGVSEAKVNSSQTLPGGMLELTFDLGPGVPEPMRVIVDPELGKVQTPGPVPEVPSVTGTPNPPRTLQ